MSDLKRFEDMTEEEKANECFSLYYPIAEFIYPRLKYFRTSKKMGYPTELNSMEEWTEILDKMLVSVYIGLHENRISQSTTAQEYQVILDGAMEGLKLFGEYCLSLWD